MKNIIVAYPVKATAMQIKNVLEEEGLYVSHLCATGASVLRIASELRGGVIVCASILSDMSANALSDRLPPGFDIVALCKSGREDYMGSFISLPLPLERDAFVKTVAVLVSSQSSYTERSRTDSDAIANAKLILMKANDMTEGQAHKYLQNFSMRCGKKLADAAREIIKEFA